MLLLLLRSIAVADWARHQCLAVAGAPESGTPSHSQDGCCCLELLRGAAEGGRQCSALSVIQAQLIPVIGPAEAGWHTGHWHSNGQHWAE